MRRGKVFSPAPLLFGVSLLAVMLAGLMGGPEGLGRAPQVSEATIRLENGRLFRMKALNFSERDRYVKSVSLNGRPLDGFVLRHTDIMRGDELVFTMAESPLEKLAFLPTEQSRRVHESRR